MNHNYLESFPDPRQPIDRLRKIHLRLLLEHNGVTFDESWPATTLAEIAMARGLNPMRHFPNENQINEIRARKNKAIVEKLKKEDADNIKKPMERELEYLNMKYFSLKKYAKDHGMNVDDNPPREQILEWLECKVNGKNPS